MAKHSDNPKPEQMDIGLPSTSGPSGPVECLGMTFPSDTERRKYFLEKLAEKLKDLEFRKIEGFPIGKDEDILTLSDPPYYTACPNPWLADFIRHYGHPYNPKEEYHREPFAADVSEGKYDPVYMLHPYPTKVPHRAIMRYIFHYTEPGDIVFDGFCGTGQTGVAAQMCNDRRTVQELGYVINKDGNLAGENGIHLSKIGARIPILSDLCPSATFIAEQYNRVPDFQEFQGKAQSILSDAENECAWMYETSHSIGSSKGRINYTAWSDVFVCPECADEVVFWNSAVTKNTGKVNSSFECPHCSASLSKHRMERVWDVRYDIDLNVTVRQAKQIPVLISYTCNGKRYQKAPDVDDLALIKKIEHTQIPYWFPKNELPAGDNTTQPRLSHGITHVHHFYSRRNLYALAAVIARIKSPELFFLITKVSFQITKLYRFTYQSGVWGAGGGPLTGTLYIPSLVKELDIIKQMKGAVQDRGRSSSAFLRQPISISTGSSCVLPQVPSESVDYIFLDPPFGGNKMYSELNLLWESWLRVMTASKQEAIESKSQQKGIDEYRDLMTQCLREAYRILKPGRWLTVEFSNTKAVVWNVIQTAMQEAGFVIANVSALDKKKKSFKAVISPTAVKQDLVISAYKPNGGLESRFAKKAETEDGVWDFIRTHLGNLPVVKPRGGLLEPIVERDPRILFDRTVAFYVRHGIPVPISSPEFQAGLAEKFPERDGMYFLSDQAAEYDKVRMKMEGIGQLVLFVEDERSAVAWLRNYFKNKPCKYQDIQPEFFEQLNQSWKKWETRPELRALLDQYFLCYSGEGDVPPQIHSYLSTNFKELRNLPADHAMLRAKAKDRWFVPDPRKNADVEQLREKRLLEEFWSYMPPGYEPAARRKTMQATLPGMELSAPKIVKGKRIAIVRTEAIRVGFNFCFSQNDYQTIIAVARYIPESVIQNDEQLQMIYDSAVTRTGGEFE